MALRFLGPSVRCSCCPSSSHSRPADRPAPLPPNADDLLLCDCACGQAEANRRPCLPNGLETARTTAVDCRIRGGEYTVVRPRQLRHLAQIWLAEAGKGDVEAEYYVGKIYEGGLGTEPRLQIGGQLVRESGAAGHSAFAVQPGCAVRERAGRAGRQHQGPSISTGAPPACSGNFVIVESGSTRR